ncbi:MAG TPA: NUDIX hydrolase [Acetobacteraceae bacterium]|nr:NUDIX hydrolase [Acetobacteraceae bacterium]
MPDTAPLLATRPPTVRARHAASVVVLRRRASGEPEVLMGMRGARHRFMPNRLVFPGGAVDRADLSAPAAAPLAAHTQALLRKKANPSLAHGLGIAAARELAEETGLTLGDPPALDGLDYLCRAVTPPPGPVRFNARFLVVDAARLSGTLAGSGELEDLRFIHLEVALALDLAAPTRFVIERLREWMGLSDAERTAPRRTGVMTRQDWRLE